MKDVQFVTENSAKQNNLEAIMTKWTLTEIADVVGGELIHAPATKLTVTSVSGDSRSLEDGALFVPIIAERDGHEFIEGAIKNGAVAAFWSEDSDKAPSDFPLIKVEDTLVAYKEMAKWHLKRVNPKVVGITGSNGKTTTKDMTTAVLQTKYKTHKTAANENNQLGVPKTILSMPNDTEVLVLEMGMSHPGEITIHSNMGQPDVAVITMIGESHIEAFDGSREKLAQEKLAILSGLKESGLFIRPVDEELITSQFDHQIRNHTFGWDDTADVYAENVIGDATSTTFTVDSETITIPVPGKYNVSNALIAILVGQEFGISLAGAKKGLENLEMTKNRLEWLDGENAIRLLNDAYNASPTSMTAALDYFADIDVDGDKIVVLGDIRELGERSKEYHEKLTEGIELSQFKAIFLYGDEMKALYEKIADEHDFVRHFTGEKEPLIKAIRETAEANDSILFKSSNGTDLLSVVDQLKI